MNFGWLNLFGGGIVLLILIPNVVYALKNKGEENLCKNRFMNLIEQVGRYACMLLMWFPLFVWEFGFASTFEMLLYFVGNAALLLAYWIIYALYLNRKTTPRALALAILPTCIFLLCGIMLHHWLLVGFAILFGVGHIYVIYHNIGEKQ